MDKSIIRILQITDLHLFEDERKSLLGIKTYETLQAVISNIKNESAVIKPDVVVISGDISQDYSSKSYEVAQSVMSYFNCPIFAIPGNHDDPHLFASILCKDKNISCSEKKVICGAWRVLLLNTQSPGDVFGFLANTEIDFLKQELEADQITPTLIFLHHHVLYVGSMWLDKIRLLNASIFLDIIAKYSNIYAVSCGHIHQEFATIYSGVSFLASPSTCLQFAQNSEIFKLDVLMPGYRWFELYSDKTFKTKVTRIKANKNFIPDTDNINGY
jgi:3',5'-cyclic-AMP phosphodiesterase